MIQRFYRLCVVCLVLALGLPGTMKTFAAGDEVEAQDPVGRIAFGSCATQLKPCPIWGTIVDYQPELLLLLGDNIYADVVDGRLKPSTPQRIVEAYQQLAALPDFDRLRRQVPIMATWDDHDYGNNDAGVEWEHKDAAATLFHDFFGTPVDSPLRKQRGIYSAKILGPPGKRLQIIMLDTRYFRSELDKADQPLAGFRARPYVPRDDQQATMLGEVQWKWLEQQLRQPADIRLVCSSIQVVSDEHPFEKWNNFPRERERLYELIRQCEASGVVLLSGDRHHGEISVEPYAVGYPLYDITASGLNQADDQWKQLEVNRNRVAGLAYGDHFGSVEIDWQRNDPQIALQLRWEDGEVAVQARVPLSKLQAQPRPLPLPKGVVSADDALEKNEGDAVEVQFAVRSGRSVGNGQRMLLNSQSDYRSDRNFTVVVNGSALVGDWAGQEGTEFVGKTIRAKGVISLYNGAKQLQVDRVEQLELVE